MYKHLLRRPAGACLELGARIAPKLWADPALASSAAALQAGQDRLTAKWTAHEEAVEEARHATGRRDEARRAMESRLRECAANVLAGVRNNHEADAYLRYFPVGFGNALREKPEGLREITRVILGLLDEESDPWLASFRDRLAPALEEYEAGQEFGDAALAARDDALCLPRGGKAFLGPGAVSVPVGGDDRLPGRCGPCRRDLHSGGRTAAGG